MSFWLTVLGMIMNLAGTLLLIFSFPLTFKKKNNRLMAYNGKDTPVHLFYERVFDKPDPWTILALILLVAGIGLQILGLWIDQT